MVVVVVVVVVVVMVVVPLVLAGLVVADLGTKEGGGLGILGRTGQRQFFSSTNRQ